MAKKSRKYDFETGQEFEVEPVNQIDAEPKVKVVSAEEAAARAEHVAKTVDAQVTEDAQKKETAALEAGKNTELLEDQVWTETEHDNPFEFISQAQILEVKTNKAGQKYIKFQAYQAERTDRKEDIGYVTEPDFRERFPKQVK